MLSFTVIRLGDTALVWAACPLGTAIAPKLSDVLHELIDSRVGRIVIDLVRVPEVDNGVVSVLAAAAERIGKNRLCLDLRMPARRSATVRDAVQLREALALAYPATAA